MAMRSFSNLEHASSKIRAKFLEWNTLHDYESFLDSKIKHGIIDQRYSTAPLGLN